MGSFYSLGFILSFAMDAFENGLLSFRANGGHDTGGLDLRFGYHDAALELTRRIVHRQGLGDILAEGSRRTDPRLEPGPHDRFSGSDYRLGNIILRDIALGRAPQSPDAHLQ